MYSPNTEPFVKIKDAGENKIMKLSPLENILFSPASLIFTNGSVFGEYIVLQARFGV
jgi:hypothetical protein